MSGAGAVIAENANSLKNLQYSRRLEKQADLYGLELPSQLGGVDLSADLDDATIAAIRAALNEHQVIFFRDQALSPERKLAFGRRFGPLNIHPYVAGMAVHPEVMEIIK